MPYPDQLSMNYLSPFFGDSPFFMGRRSALQRMGTAIEANFTGDTQIPNNICTLRISLYTVVLSGIFVALFLFSIMGNAFVIITILGKRHLANRSVTNLYLLNLAVADLLRSIVCIPSTLVSELYACWMFGPALCKISAYLQPVGVCASAYTLAVIAIERYYACCRPLHSRKWHTKRRAVAMLLMVWALSFASNAVSLVMFEFKENSYHRACDIVYSGSIMFLYQLYLTLVLLFIPLTVMVGLYGHVIYTLNSAIENNDFTANILEKVPTDRSASITDWFFSAVRISKFSETFESMRSGKCSLRSSFTMVPSPSSRLTGFSFSMGDGGSRSPNIFLRSSNQERILIAKRKVTRMLITIVVLFAACWIPSYVWWLIVRMEDLVGVQIWNAEVNTVLTLLTYISSCTNPMTYCFMNKSFRHALLSYFRRRKRGHSPPAPRSNSSPPAANLGGHAVGMPAIPKIRIDLVSTTQ